ncbi:MAG: ABC transporter permease [Spirochaetales bacterium]|nr:ABC transporter permease [Spirochaetales bacterium]
MIDTAMEHAGETKKHLFFVDILRRLVKEKPLGTVGGIITVLLLLVGIFADLISPYGMNETDISSRLMPPSAQHLLGTDNVGRDITSRVIYGARVSVIVGLSAASLATVVSLVIGMLSGYFGGKFDIITQRFVDIFQCIPHLLLLMIIVTIIGAGMWQIILAMGLATGIVGSRIIRSAVMGVKEYVRAAESIGCSTARVLLRHILPNIAAPTIILFTTRVPAMILTEASLSFLGFGIPPPTPTWGGMLGGSGRVYMFHAPWMVVWPGLALALVIYGVNMFGDALRDLLDPRLRGGAGRYGLASQKVRKKYREAG